MQCRLLKKFSLTSTSFFSSFIAGVVASLVSSFSASASSLIAQVPYVSVPINGIPTMFVASKNGTGITPITLVDTNVGFKLFDFNILSSADTAGANVIKFVITSPSPFVSIFAVATTGTAQVPIVWAQGAPCVAAPDTTNASGTCSNQAMTTHGYLSALNLNPNTSLEIGINLDDLCQAQPTVIGCDQVTSTHVDTAITGTHTNISPFQLTFEFGTAISASTGGDQVTQNIQVEITPPTFGCPTNNDTLYFPGDTAISLDPSVFQAQTPPLTNSTPNTLIFVAADGAAPDTTANFTTNAVIARIPLGGGPFNVGGFNDTTTGTDHVYRVAFSEGDLSGALSQFTTCGISGIQTSPIQTFLKKSGCFIATAAFRSGEDEPVLMLRRFRDQVLLEHDLGQLFVKWYYSWSPAAAEWLMENPIFRYPVLLALVPVQILGWLGLHSLVLVGLLSVSLSVTGFALRRRS